MRSKNFILIMAMLVLAVFAVGSVSAAENVTTDIDVQTDDIALDDVSVEEDVDQEEITEGVTTNSPTIYNVNHTSNFTYYMSTANISNKVILNFTDDTYDDFSLTLNSYVELWGNGVTLNGAASQDIFTVTNTNNIVIKDFIINVGSNAAAIYGHNVTHSVFTNNNITGGKDGINIFQVHENLTITDNTISGFTRDGISLVNYNTLNDTAWNDFVASNVSNNKISSNRNLSGNQYGMFFGGNFKGVICNNDISDVEYGIEFVGKGTATNGRLNVTICNTNIADVSYGIHLNHPSVEYFKLYHMYINSDICDILTGDNFVKTGYIYVYNSTFNGEIDPNFYNNVTAESGNDGFEP